MSNELQVPEYLKGVAPSANNDLNAAIASSISVPRLSLRGKVFRFVENGEEIKKSNTPIDVIILGVEPEATSLVIQIRLIVLRTMDFAPRLGSTSRSLTCAKPVSGTSLGRPHRPTASQPRSVGTLSSCGCFALMIHKALKVCSMAST
jgi:hypothetical protein